jgi:hypothetical protein
MEGLTWIFDHSHVFTGITMSTDSSQLEDDWSVLNTYPLSPFNVRIGRDGAKYLTPRRDTNNTKTGWSGNLHKDFD